MDHPGCPCGKASDEHHSYRGYDVADCHLALGKLHRRAGDAAQAREHLTAAAAMCREMDLRFWQKPADEELRALVESC